MNLPMIDAHWRAANPLPGVGAGLDKDARGRVLLVGGSAFVQGAIRLTGEAALRVGAGKLQMATIASLAAAVGVLIPEAAMIALPEDDDGEITLAAAERLAKPLTRCDTLILGPAMREQPQTAALLCRLLAVKPKVAVLDAGAISAACRCVEAVSAFGAAVLTPHHGELAMLMKTDKDAVASDPVASARAAAERFAAIVVLKSDETVIAAPDGTLLGYASDAPGLGTGGSGDVLAGVIGGLAARGCRPLVAAVWGVWLHGEAGKAAAARVGPVGFLARELPGEIPRLMGAQNQR